jgi:hypothetical protein
MADTRNEFNNTIDNFVSKINRRNEDMVDDANWFLTSTFEKTSKARRDGWNDWGAFQKDTKSGNDFNAALMGVSSPLIVQ